MPLLEPFPHRLRFALNAIVLDARFSRRARFIDVVDGRRAVEHAVAAGRVHMDTILIAADGNSHAPLNQAADRVYPDRGLEWQRAHVAERLERGGGFFRVGEELNIEAVLTVIEAVGDVQ